MLERIDRAIDRLDDALRSAELAGLEAPDDSRALDEVDEAVAPYRLPLDLRRFWERVVFSKLSISGWRLANLCDPADALATHRMNNEPEFAGLFGPPLLFPIAQISGEQWSVELASEWSEGGPVFSYEIAPAHRIEYPAFVDLVEVYAELVEGRAFEVFGEHHSLLLEPEQEKQEARFRETWPHPLYGDAREVSTDPVGWPAHWLAAAGIDPQSRVPRGATHTIAELVEGAQSGEVVGRVVGTVAWVGGSSDGVLAVVDDGATQLDVWCPIGTSPWGPSMSGRFEFEVALRGGVPPSALGTPPLLEFLQDVGRKGPAAVALDVRPVDD